jgi:hypothetical protein
MFQTKVVQKIKNTFLTFHNLFSDNRAVYEILWKNIVFPGRPQMTIWLIASFTPKCTITHSNT